MSGRSVTDDQPAATTDRSTGSAAAIPVGAIRIDGTVREGRYDPDADVVRVAPEGGAPTETITPATWVARAREATVDRVARQLCELLQAGEILDQPECGATDCTCRLTPYELEHSDQVAGIDQSRCRYCLPDHIDDRPPWVHPEDRTVDRSVVATVQDHSN